MLQKNKNWGSRDKSFQGVKENFDSLLKFFQLEHIIKDPNSGHKAVWLASELKQFKTVFVVCLLTEVFTLTNILHKNLQSEDLHLLHVIDLATYRVPVKRNPTIFFSKKFLSDFIPWLKIRL